MEMTLNSSNFAETIKNHKEVNMWTIMDKTN